MNSAPAIATTAALFTLLCIGPGCRPPDHHADPRGPETIVGRRALPALFARDGVLDLRAWDFDSPRLLHLHGNWKFYWRRFIDPAQGEQAPPDSDAFANPEPLRGRAFVPPPRARSKGSLFVPGEWNAFRLAPGAEAGALSVTPHIV